MRRRPSLVSSLAALAALLGAGADRAGAGEGGPPNLLVILTDDQGWPTLGSYGGDKVPTPHLDALAARGTRFTRAYVTPQCTPTRATLLTGRYAPGHRMWHVIGPYGYPFARVEEPSFRANLPRDAWTFPKALREAGYVTAIAGKWHLTNGEDGNYIGLNPAAATRYGFDHAPPPVGPEQFEPGADRGVDLLTEQTLAFVERNRDRPWFCLLSHHAVHGKVVAPEPLVEKYLALGTPEEGRRNATYLALLDHLDASVGRLTAGLECLGEAEETVIVFLSDNGGVDVKLGGTDLPSAEPGATLPAVERQYDNAPLREGKGSLYEGGVRVPLIAAGPGIGAGRVVTEPVHAVDLAPTLLSLAGAEVASLPENAALAGVDLSPALTGESTALLADRPVYQYCPFYDLRWGLTPGASVVRGQWKLIAFFGDRIDGGDAPGRSAGEDAGVYRVGPAAELYDLAADPGEQVDLAAARPEIAAELNTLLRDWITASGATIPGPNPAFDPARGFTEIRGVGAEPTRERPR
ncbi:sulfatase-like hydrolase/transferase [Alienimonas sp. DA493]|uniref:sulfatase-like hydrolase/transferase n=1 Tax=Alienimonas sp. DA493 TaxID=3373605 RepID=UPI0037545663